MIDFPSNPSVGQNFTASGVTWTWDGTKWAGSGLSVAYLPLAGGTMLGPLTLAADPVPALGAATKQYVDGGRLGDNRIINGDMRVNQYGGSSGTVAGITIDRWKLGMNQPGKLSWSAVASVAMAANGFPRVLQATSLSAYAPAATDSFCFFHPIEADMISDFAFGTPNAQPITLSFWVMASVAGAYSGAISNYGPPVNRCYPFSFNIAAASTWQKFAITIPGDTGGTWAMSGNAGSMYVTFDLGSGASVRGAAGSWQNINANGVSGAASIVTTNGALMQFTGVKLEIGNVATPYNRQSLTKSLADCQRYYQVINPVLGSVTYASAAGNNFWNPFTLLTAMRAVPTATISVGSYSNCSGATVLPQSGSTFYITALVTAAGAATYGASLTFSAEL